MTLVADIPAQGAPAYSIERQVRDQRIAVAEMWLCMLGGLREIGMRFAAFLEHQVAPSKAGPRRLMMAFRFIGDPCAAFSRVWRAVHLAAALALRIADEIAALRAGKPLGSAAPAAKTAREAKAIKDKIHEIGLEALAEDIETAERPEGLHGGLNDMLREERMDAAFYRLLKGPVKDVVAAICADLGLNPDWSQWTEDGFPPPPGGQKEDWVTYFIPEGEVESTPTQDRRAPRTPPPRRDAPCAWDKAWRPLWPASTKAARAVGVGLPARADQVDGAKSGVNDAWGVTPPRHGLRKGPLAPTILEAGLARRLSSEPRSSPAPPGRLSALSRV